MQVLSSRLMSGDNNGVRPESALSMLISINKGFIKIAQQELGPIDDAMFCSQFKNRKRSSLL
jgi:hypothetical protein